MQALGKSRLVQMLKEHNRTGAAIRGGNAGVREYSQNTALFPLVDLFPRILQFEAYETPDAN